MSTLAATTAPVADWRLAVVLAVLLALGVGVSLLARLGSARDQITAAVRAVVQLAVVSALIAAVLASLAWSLAFVALMFAVATGTATRRLGLGLADVAWVGGAIAAGAVPVVTLCLASGVVPFNGAGVIPIAGIVTGGAMTAATLTGRRAYADLAAHTGTYEAGLALGLPRAEASRLVIGPSAREALLPGLDQTRTVGLVTLPGAFIGVLLGGGTAIDAGAAQVLVLFGLLAAQALTAATLLESIARGRLLPQSLRTLAR